MFGNSMVVMSSERKRTRPYCPLAKVTIYRSDEMYGRNDRGPATMRRGRDFNTEARHESQWIEVQRISAYATVIQNRMYPWTTLSDAFVI
jgi:hypothetical protein